jgi:superfamily II DNA or RNA helicase
MRDLGAYFEALAYEYPLPRAIAEGYLSRIMAHTIPLKIDVSDVKVLAGDFQASGIGRALEPYLPQISQEVASLCRQRKLLIFAPLCDTAQRIQAAVEAAGLRCFYCSGEDRSQIPAWEAHGHGCAMVNAMLLTEGYDHPPIDAVCVLRPTKVRSLYAQMVGRGTRPVEGKDHLLLLDFLWMSQRHQLCRPAHLLAEDDAVAEKMTKAAEDEAGTDVAVDAEALAEAKREVVAEREAALAKKLAEMRHKKRALVDPLQFAMSIGDESLAGYTPALKAEAAPPSPRQIEELGKAGIWAGDVASAGLADAILRRLKDRAGLATPKHIRQLEKRGWKNVGQMTHADAAQVMMRLNANMWQMSDGLRGMRDEWNARGTK